MPTPFQRSARLGGALIALVAALAIAVSPGTAVAHDETPAAGEHAGHAAHGGMPSREPTAEERAAADRLLAATREGTARFADPAVAAAEGYRPATPYAFYGLRAAHFVNPTFGLDGAYLDPESPETLVYLKEDDGTLRLIGVMFTAPAGAGPRVGGPLLDWHSHPDLCGARAGLVTMNPDGACPTGTFPLDFEMLHVWLIDVPCGPFADNPLGESDASLVGVGDAHNSIVAGAGLIDDAALIDGVAELLRLDPAEIGRRYQAGENLAEMASVQNVPRSELVALLRDQITAGLAAAVARGDMTVPQHDLTIRNLPAQIERMVDIRAGEPWVKPSV